MSIEKIKREINKTKKVLKQYGCSFIEYMKDAGRRGDIDLGDKVSTKSGSNGIVVGWNNSCNYNVFLFTKGTVYNVHPNDVTRIDEGIK
jgi:hypothetical protein